MHARVIDLLGQKGPQTGGELLETSGVDPLLLWKACRSTPGVEIRRVGRRYLRLDRRVNGFARLSPSILREFLTYSVIGLADDPAATDERLERLRAHIEEVSRQKLALAKRIVRDIAAPLAASAEESAWPERGAGEGESRFCVVVAGDVVYGMAHDVRRPERSTGSPVNGSDLDIVVIVQDDAPDELVATLDDTIYQKKYQYLKNPAFREEIDYVVKRFGRLREQTSFDTFKRMVACKIFDEAVLIYGSSALFTAGKALLREHGVVERLREMEQSAIVAREERERCLLATDPKLLRGEDLFLFHTDDESEEFE